MLLQKYRPKSMAEVLANGRHGFQIKKWIGEWTKGKSPAGQGGSSSGALIISGPPGTGKDTVIELAARELGYEIRRGAPEDLLLTASEASLWNRGKVLVVDLDHGKDYKKLEELVEKSAWPVVALTTDIYQKHLKDLRRGYIIVRFNKIFPSELAGFLARVCRAEGIKFSERALFALAKMSDGDVRFCLIALDGLDEVNDASIDAIMKDSTETMFSTLDKIFARNMDDIDLSLVPTLLENLAEKYSGLQLSLAYRLLALAEYFSHKNGDYSQHFLRLLPRAMAAGYTQYKFPAWENIYAEKEMLQEIASRTHCSSRKARAYKILVRGM